MPTIAQALEITEAPPEPLRQTLARALADQRVLLLVDNFEHVIDAAPDVSFLVEHAAELTVLKPVASRFDFLPSIDTRCHRWNCPTPTTISTRSRRRTPSPSSSIGLARRKPDSR